MDPEPATHFVTVALKQITDELLELEKKEGVMTNSVVMHGLEANKATLPRLQRVRKMALKYYSARDTLLEIEKLLEELNGLEPMEN